MPAHLTGSIRTRAKGFQARVFVGDGRRLYVDLPLCRDEDVARTRAAALSIFAARLLRADLGLQVIEVVIQRAGAAREEDMATIGRYIESLCAKGVESLASPILVTFRDIGERWTSGDLARTFPDHVRVKRSADTDAYRLARHVYPHVGDVPVATFRLDDAERVMAALPTGPTHRGPRKARGLETNSRRQVAQLLGRVMALAVYPLRLRESSPIPRGWLPKKADEKALVWLFPDEDAILLACTSIPLGYRVLYGVLAREGLRVGEALSLLKTDVDLGRGVLSLDENKTDDPRMWALGEGVVRGLTRWCERWRGTRLFDVGGELADDHLANKLRDYLRVAGVTRDALFERSKARRPLRVHDLRATFVTLSLAHGRSEMWVSDRTGHRSSDQLRGYARAARTAAELNLPPLTPLDEAIPELRAPQLRLVSA